jgi:hypothetical protein
MKFNLNEDGSKFMRVIAWNRSGCVLQDESRNNDWWRQLEPTLVIDVCVSAYAQVSKRHDLNHFGSTTKLLLTVAQNLRNWWLWCRKKPGLFFHDAWNEYAVNCQKR